MGVGVGVWVCACVCTQWRVIGAGNISYFLLSFFSVMFLLHCRHLLFLFIFIHLHDNLFISLSLSLSLSLRLSPCFIIPALFSLSLSSVYRVLTCHFPTQQFEFELKIHFEMSSNPINPSLNPFGRFSNATVARWRRWRQCTPVDPFPSWPPPPAPTPPPGPNPASPF